VKDTAAAVIMDPREAPIAEYPGVTLYPVNEGSDTAPAIRASVDGGAKILFVDGLRDAEAIEAALDAALGGVLVIATMHTQASGAAQRLLDAFPDSGNAKIRAKVRLALRGVLEQVLVRRAGGQPGRVLASEVWVETTRDADDILAPAISLAECLKVLDEQGALDPESMERALLHRW
jgi:twitching motility protein PilT